MLFNNNNVYIVVFILTIGADDFFLFLFVENFLSYTIVFSLIYIHKLTLKKSKLSRSNYSTSGLMINLSSDNEDDDDHHHYYYGHFSIVVVAVVKITTDFFNCQ